MQGAIPQGGYPICTYNLQFIYWEILNKAGFDKKPAMQCPGSLGAGDYFGNMICPPYSASFSASVFNPGHFTGLPSNTWIEITHGAVANGEEGVGAWMYAAPGSGVWFDTGSTKVYADHHQSYADLCPDHGATPPPDCGFAVLFTQAKAKGYDSIQYTDHADQQCGRSMPNGRHEWAIEIVSTTEVGSFACGGQKTQWRAGWEASDTCDCDNNFKDPGSDSLQFNCNGYAMRRW